jgi:hypothetical protein
MSTTMNPKVWPLPTERDLVEITALRGDSDG